MSNQSDRVRASIRQRVLELIQRDLPMGWECKVVSDEIEIATEQNEKPHTHRISLAKLYTQVEKNPDQRRQALHLFANHVVKMIRDLKNQAGLTENETAIFPVLRHKTFLQHPTGRSLVTREHTPETIITYALDQGESYRLVEESMLEEAGWTEERLHTCAIQNLKGLPVPTRTQQVGTTIVHFIAPQDGYAASRILLTDLLDLYHSKKRGKSLGVAIPHQDVLIIVDIQDEIGTQLLARLTYDFATKGDIPISPLPFIYVDGSLETYFVIQHKPKG